MNYKLNKIDKNQYLKITSHKGWFDFNLKEIWRYKDLMFLFVKRDVTTFYKQTILGPLWFLIQPLITTLVFSLIFNKIAKLPTDLTPPYLFYLSGIIAWNYFSDCLLSTTDTFTSNTSIFSKVYFPRIILPISKVISNLVKLFIQLILFFCFLSFYYFNGITVFLFSKNIILLPLMILQMALLGLAIGMIVSSLTTKYKDLRFLIAFSIQLLMYATPIAYPFSEVPEKYKYIILSNPMTPIVTTFRYSLLGNGYFDLSLFYYSLSITFFLFFIGLLFFNRVEKSFIDTI